MARGWASKDADDPQDLRDERKAEAARKEKSALEQKLEDLNLQSTRVLHDLQTACNPRYRAMVEESLRFLEDQIRSLTVQKMKVVEAVGVEPTSEMAAPLKPTCVSTSLFIRLRLLRSSKTSPNLVRLMSVAGYEQKPLTHSVK